MPSKFSMKKPILAASIGTVIEYYDDMVFGNLIFLISPIFFMYKNHTMNYIMTSAIFVVGLFFRPIGAILFGYIGDTYGRKLALQISVIAIAFPTFIIGIAPTYEDVGIIAPLILLACRMLQGLFVGGESSGAAIFLVEHAKKKHEGLMSSLLSVSFIVGSLLGLSITIVCTKLFSQTIAWRIPFIIGGLLSILGYYIRTSFYETPAFRKEGLPEKNKIYKKPIVNLLLHSKINLLKTIGVCAGVSTPYYISYIYLSNLISLNNLFPKETILIINTVTTTIWLILLPIMGYISDKIGHKFLMRLGAFGLIFSASQLWQIDINLISIKRLLMLQLTISLFATAMTAPCCAYVAKLFPVTTRYTGVSLGWSIGLVIFAGLFPLFSLIATAWENNQHIPAFMLIVTSLLILISLRKNTVINEDRILIS